MAAEFNSADEEDPVLVMMTKDASFGSTTPLLADETDGVWLPNYIFPTPLLPFDFDIVRQLMLDPAVPAAVKVGRGAVRQLLICGVGQKTGEFVLFHLRRKIYVRGSGVVKERGFLEANDNNNNNSQKPRMWTEVVDMESEAEMLATLAEEFPLLVDDAQDSLEFFSGFVDQD